MLAGYALSPMSLAPFDRETVCNTEFLRKTRRNFDQNQIWKFSLQSKINVFGQWTNLQLGRFIVYQVNLYLIRDSNQL